MSQTNHTEPAKQPIAQLPPEDRVGLAKTATTGTWLAVVLTAVALAGVLIWACVAQIPQIAQANGVIVAPIPRVEIPAQVAGQVTSIELIPTQTVQVGQPILWITPAAGKAPIAVSSPVSGMLRAVEPNVGQLVSVGQTVAAIAPSTKDQELSAVGFASPQQIAEFRAGQPALVQSLDTGATVSGTVSVPSDEPANLEELTELLGDEQSASLAFEAAGGVPIPVVVHLGKNPQWSGSTDAAVRERVQIVQQLSSKRPIQWLFP